MRNGKLSADFVLQDNKFLVAGELSFANARAILEKSMQYLERYPALHFDFSKLQSSDSAGLALIIEWIKWAKENNKPLHITALSPNLLALAQAAGVSELIRVNGNLS